MSDKTDKRQTDEDLKSAAEVEREHPEPGIEPGLAPSIAPLVRAPRLLDAGAKGNRSLLAPDDPVSSLEMERSEKSSD